MDQKLSNEYISEINILIAKLLSVNKSSFNVRLRVLADVKNLESTVRDLARFKVRAGKPLINRVA